MKTHISKKTIRPLLLEYVLANPPIKSLYKTLEGLSGTLEDSNFESLKGLFETLSIDITLIDDLFCHGDGPIGFLDEDRKPIIYGTNNKDKISGTITSSDFDISRSAFRLLNNHLANYVKRGIHYIAGNDTKFIEGTNYDDVFEGPEEQDLTFIGGDGHNTYYVSHHHTIIANGYHPYDKIYLYDELLYDTFFPIYGIKEDLVKKHGNDLLINLYYLDEKPAPGLLIKNFFSDAVIIADNRDHGNWVMYENFSMHITVHPKAF